MTGERRADLAPAIQLIRNQGKGALVILTPVVWKITPKGKEWYFTFVTAQPGASENAVLDVVVEAGPNEKMAVQVRTQLVFDLLLEKPIVVIDCDDELEAVKLCEGTWPGSRFASLRRAIEKERAH